MAATDDPARRIRVIDAFPELASQLGEDRARLARQHALATLEVIEPGAWSPVPGLQRRPGHLGLLVLEGYMTRDVVLGDTVATELVGRGDLLRPADHDGASAPVPFDVTWTVLVPSRVAILDSRFAQVVGHFPEVLEVIVRSSVRRSHSLALHLAVSHLRRVDTRLHVLMWHLADRWGRVTAGGIHVPLKLTHQVLGRLVGAQRPSVTTALKQLTEQAVVTREADGTWMLHGSPPSELRRLREAASSALA